MQIVRVLVFMISWSLAGSAFAHPALIPLPASVTWGDGQVAIDDNTIVERRGKAAPTGDYLANELRLKQAGRGASRIRLSLVPASKIANAEGYHLQAAGNEVLIEASDPRGLFYGAQTLRQLVTDSSVPSVDITDSPRLLRHAESAKGNPPSTLQSNEKAHSRPGRRLRRT